MSLEDDVRGYLESHPDASANEVFKALGGSRPVVLREVARYRSAGTESPGTAIPPVPPSSELPPDIEAVWGQGRRDSSGSLAADTARQLIGSWGLEAFRSSAVHRTALGELRFHEQRRLARERFLAEMKKEKARA